MPTTGTVTTVNTTSVSIQLSGNGGTKTFSITSSTGMGEPTTTSNGAEQIQAEPYNASAIHIGETIAVVPSSTNSSQAQMIMLNPPQS
jgi:hypothetical protein